MFQSSQQTRGTVNSSRAPELTLEGILITMQVFSPLFWLTRDEDNNEADEEQKRLIRLLLFLYENCWEDTSFLNILSAERRRRKQCQIGREALLYPDDAP
jgi:hypothetical protein